MIKTDMGYCYSPQTILDECLFYDKIHDEYIQGIEELVEKELKNFSNEIEIENCSDDNYDPSDISVRQIDRYRNYWDDDNFVNYFKKKLPSLIRGSALISLFSIFEKNLKDISNKFLSFSNLNVKFNDLYGNALEKFKTALRILNNKLIDENGIYELNSQLFNEDNFKIIKDAQKIRNIFAHNDGVLSKEKTKDIFLLKKNNPYFSFEDDLILIEKGALHFVSENMRGFLQRIIINHNHI